MFQAFLSASGFLRWRMRRSGRALPTCAPAGDYDPLYQSALCRQKADWLIGINASRLFSVLYHRTLNVGRVQTPTLAMLAERDKQDRPVPQGEIPSCAAGAGGSRGGQRPHCFPGGCPGHPGRLRWAAGRVCIPGVEKKTEKPPKTVRT